MSEFVKQIVAHRVWLIGLVLDVTLSIYGEGIRIVYSHRPHVVQMAVTNRAAAARTVAKVTTSCASLNAENALRTGMLVPPVVEDYASYDNKTRRVFALYGKNMIDSLLKGALS